MTATMFAQNLYGPGSGGAGQTVTNAPAGTSKVATATPGNGTWGNVPVLPGISAATGMSVPTLIAMGVLAWWLFRQY